MADIHEHETRTDTGGGVASGMVLGIVLVVLVVAIAAFLFFGNAFRGTTTPAQPSNNPTNIQVNPPSAPPGKVDVNVNPPAQQAPSQPGPSQPGPSQPAPNKP